MKQKELVAIRERCEAATPGPWEMHANLGYCGIMADGDKVPLLNADGCTFADGAFVAHARADVPALLDEIKSLRIEIDELKQELYAKIAMLQELLQDTEMLNSDAAYSRLIMRDYNE